MCLLVFHILEFSVMKQSVMTIMTALVTSPYKREWMYDVKVCERKSCSELSCSSLIYLFVSLKYSNKIFIHLFLVSTLLNFKSRFYKANKVVLEPGS